MNKKALLEETLTRSVIGAFYEVYSNLGFGFLEHLHVSALERELRSRKHRVARELSVNVMYKGEQLGMQLACCCTSAQRRCSIERFTRITSRHME